MIDKLIQFLNLSEDQLTQFNKLKADLEKDDEKWNNQLKDIWQQKKDSWKTQKDAFEQILNDEQKDRMKSLFDLFMPFNSKKSA